MQELTQRHHFEIEVRLLAPSIESSMISGILKASLLPLLFYGERVKFTRGNERRRHHRVYPRVFRCCLRQV